MRRCRAVIILAVLGGGEEEGGLRHEISIRLFFFFFPGSEQEQRTQQRSTLQRHADAFVPGRETGTSGEIKDGDNGEQNRGEKV